MMDTAQQLQLKQPRDSTEKYVQECLRSEHHKQEIVRLQELKTQSSKFLDTQMTFKMVNGVMIKTRRQQE